ncbi:MAG: periplasmic heavy metal sensor [Dehalococcoidia bacterium]|nr:MAG: periplasmic heavy metal sensor [Dehalococcoidia bacterium]
MKIRLLISAGVMVVIASLLFVAMPVYAEKDSGYCLPWQKSVAQKQEKFDKMIEALGLSDEQVAQLKDRKQAKMKSREKLHSALKKQKQELRDELEKPESDNARIKQIADSIKQIQSEMIDERIKGILEIKAILTPEQYSKFKEKIGHHKERKQQKARGKKNFS